MNCWRKLQLRLRALFQKRKLDAEMDEEMRSHIAMQTQENIDAGMNPEEARYAALRQFGWVESIKEKCRDQRGVVWIENLVQDIRYGARMLRKNPVSTVMAVLILALGIGGNTAVFSVADKAIVRPVPAKESERCVGIQEVDTLHDQRWGVSPHLFANVSTHTNIFVSLSAFVPNPERLTLERGANTLSLRGAKTTPDFFEMFGVRPLAGRTFLAYEGKPGNDGVLVASYGLWEQYFGKDPKFVGSTITLSGHAYTVVGIMPPRIQFPLNPGENQFWIPHVFTVEETTNPDYNINRTWWVIGRLQNGASLEQARALLDTVAQTREKDYPETEHKWMIEAEPARTIFVHPALERTLWSLQASVLMLLLISCANVGTLSLARAVAPRGEFSTRLAMGAGRLRVVRQLVTESLMLAGVAGLFGVFFAWGGISALDHFYLIDLRRMKEVGLDGSVLALTVMVSALSGLVFGVAPVWLVSRLRLADSLKDTSQQHSDGLVQRFFRDGLVVAQMSLAVVLLVGAGLMIQSTVRLLRVNPGLAPAGLFGAFFPPLPFSTSDFDAQIARNLVWQANMIERLRSIPGLESVSIRSARSWPDLQIEGWDEKVRLERNHVGLSLGDSFFRALRVPLVAGRPLTPEDSVPGQRSIVVNREFVRRFWPGQDPLGKRVNVIAETGTSSATPRTLVVAGVVENIKEWGRDEDPQPIWYEPAERMVESHVNSSGPVILIRSKTDLDLLRKMVAQIGGEMAPALDLVDLYSIEKNLYASTASRRIYMWLLLTMGGLGLLLSALGVYAVMAYAVVRRTREIGVRMALGATGGNIARWILWRGGRLVLNGMILGAAAAFTLAHYIENLLYQVKPGDPWAFVGVVLTLGAVAGIACYIPARRATRINPMEALRYE